MEQLPLVLKLMPPPLRPEVLSVTVFEVSSQLALSENCIPPPYAPQVFSEIVFNWRLQLPLLVR